MCAAVTSNSGLVASRWRANAATTVCGAFLPFVGGRLIVGGCPLGGLVGALGDGFPGVLGGNLQPEVGALLHCLQFIRCYIKNGEIISERI